MHPIGYNMEYISSRAIFLYLMTCSIPHPQSVHNYEGAENGWWSLSSSFYGLMSLFLLVSVYYSCSIFNDEYNPGIYGLYSWLLLLSLNYRHMTHRFHELWMAMLVLLHRRGLFLCTVMIALIWLMFVTTSGQTPRIEPGPMLRT